MPNYNSPVANSPINGSVNVSGSKSIMNRALILSMLSRSTTTIKNPLFSRDSNLMIEAMKTLGAEIERKDDSQLVLQGPQKIVGGEIFCGLSGTVMRFVPPVSALASGNSTFSGDKAAQSRPQKVIIEALEQLNIQVKGEKLPFTVLGKGEDLTSIGNKVEIDASTSSQFVSGLLLASPAFPYGMQVTNIGSKLPSQPHIDMTLAMLNHCGVTIESKSNFWKIEPTPINPVSWNIEPDLSNSCVFLAAALVTGGTIKIPGFSDSSVQPLNRVMDLLTKMGGIVELTNKGLKVTGTGKINAINEDLSDISELTPTIAAISVFSENTTVLKGVAHIAGHETNRIKAIAQEINNIGGNCTYDEDSITINPGKLKADNTQWNCYEDHRMATMGAIIGLKVPGIILEDISTTAKTMPNFEQLWNKLVTNG